MEFFSSFTPFSCWCFLKFCNFHLGLVSCQTWKAEEDLSSESRSRRSGEREVYSQGKKGKARVEISVRSPDLVAWWAKIAEGPFSYFDAEFLKEGSHSRF